MTNEYTPLISGLNSDPPPPFDNDSNNDNLTKFRTAIGIHQDTSGDDLESARKSAKGLYKEVIRLQTWRGRQYRAVETAFYGALGAQVVIGATLAALGPLSKPHPKAITILGITNTSIAGLLAVLKGQGLPDRFRKDEYQMKKVQDFIEEMDTRLALDGEDKFTAEELDEVVKQVFEKYNTAIDTAEMNKPSSYVHQIENMVSGGDAGGSTAVSRFMGPSGETDKGKGKLVMD